MGSYGDPGVYYSFFSCMYEIMFMHSYIPADATQIVICPIIKDKNGDFW